MIDFNNVEEIKKIDPQDTLGSTMLLPKQLQAAWEQVNQIRIPDGYREINTIVFCGMGASIYGALVVKSLLGPNFPHPSEVVTDYHLPGYVNQNTLVVLTSYSGSTEEVLSCAQEAKEKGAKMLVLTKGGKLADFAKENNIPCYIFDGALNPAGVPRLGNGYTILGLIGLLVNAGVIHINKEDIETAITRLGQKIEDIRQMAIAAVPLFENKIPIIFAAEHLSGNAQIFRNQFNETSKSFSSYFLVPDLNHHLMEGLQFPKQSQLVFFIFDSPNYTEKIKKRMQLTNDVVKKNNREIHTFQADGQTIYDDFLQVLAFGSFVTLYLGLYYDQNPAINPWVDWFKEELAK